MRKLDRIAVAPAALATIGLLLALTACSGGPVSKPPTAASASAGSATSNAAATATSATTGAAAATPTAPSTSPSTATAAPASTGGASSPPFPGIWDITTWQQYRTDQAAVEQGHQPWLLDPLSIVQAWASDWTPTPTITKTGTYQLTKPGTDTLYTINLTCPDPHSPAPIWVITAINHN